MHLPAGDPSARLSPAELRDVQCPTEHTDPCFSHGNAALKFLALPPALDASHKEAVALITNVTLISLFHTNFSRFRTFQDCLQ